MGRKCKIYDASLNRSHITTYLAACVYDLFNGQVTISAFIIKIKNTRGHFLNVFILFLPLEFYVFRVSRMRASRKEIYKVGALYKE